MLDNFKNLSFEEALSELEKIVHALEGGKMTLEDSITSYERGALLRQYCENKLNEAESRIQFITQQPDGSLTTSSS